MACDWSHHTGFVALYAARIRFYASNLIQAHEFGAPSGFDNEPWGPRYQRRAVKIYSELLPTDYLERIGSVFAGCVKVMDTHPRNAAATSNADWHIVRSYFHHAADAITDAFELTLEPRWEDPTDQEPVTPGILRFDLLAGLVSPEGADRLYSAGNSVAEALAARATRNPLEAHHLAILRCLAAGETAADIAEHHGYSRRSLYRQIDNICALLEVANWQQAIAFTAEHGWLQTVSNRH